MGCLLWINWLIWILQINSYKGIQKIIHDIISGDEFRSCMLYAIARYTGCCFYGAWLYRSCNWPPLSGVYQNISIMSYKNGQNRHREYDTSGNVAGLGWLTLIPWWRHQWKHLPRYRPFLKGESSVTGQFPSQRPLTRSFDPFFDLRLTKGLSKQSRRPPVIWYAV